MQPDSQAGYRARQKLLYQPIEVSGRTSKITGSATVAESRLVSADFVVDAASLQSAHRGRDEKFRGTDVMDAGKFPTAEVKVTTPVDLTSVPDTGKAADVEIPPLTVTLHGVTRPESAHTSIQRNGDRVDVAGSIPIRFADYGIHPPALLGGGAGDPAGGHHRVLGASGQELTRSARCAGASEPQPAPAWPVCADPHTATAGAARAPTRPHLLELGAQELAYVIERGIGPAVDGSIGSPVRS